VLKPTSLSASQGVIRANSRGEFIEAAERIRRLLESPGIRERREENTDHLIVEEYIAGKEVAVEGVLTEGQLRVLAIFDKPDPLEGPYFEETIYVTPSRHASEVKAEIERSAREAVGALGLTHGPVHAEFRINEKGVWPLEVAPRPIGGLCARALRLTSEDLGGTISLEELLLRHALGEMKEIPRREMTASAVMMIPVPESGILEGVEGEEEARRTEGIAELFITARMKDPITAWPEGSSYLGFLFAKGERPEEAEEAVRAAHAKLRFVITPQLPVEHPVTGQFHNAQR
jgi:biotin carboxylase